MKGSTRRNFLKNSAFASLVAAGGCSAFDIGRSDPRRPLASERISLAVIGCGAMGNWNLTPFLDDKRVQVTVTCDPVRDAKAYGYSKDWTKKWRGGRVPFAEKVDKFYGRPGCRAVADWREIIDDPTVDAVLVTTPDHWHALIAIAAMRSGKHVYCQKPLTMSVAEGRRMCEVAAESGVVFQVGSQQRSSPEFLETAELVRNGYLGDCRSCTIGLSYAHNDASRNGFPRDVKSRRELPDYWKMTPEEWNLWQGPAEHWPDNAFIPGIHGPIVWRWNDRTGNGALPDWGAHHLDILQWSLGTEYGGPVAIENVTTDMADPSVVDRYFNWPKAFKFDVVYANGFRATVGDSDTIGFTGLRYHAPKGDLFVTRGKLEKPAHLANWKETDLLPSEVRLHKSRGTHESDFVDGIYDPNWKVACPCEIGHRSITISHLANSCAKTGLKGCGWDPVKEVSDCDEINARADIRRYNGWHLG